VLLALAAGLCMTAADAAPVLLLVTDGAANNNLTSRRQAHSAGFRLKSGRST
jgi:hypothetical protein